MTVAALDLGSGADLQFFLEFTEADGTRRREPLAVCVAGRFEDVLPVRTFQWAKGASHFPGLWWSSTTGITWDSSRGWNATTLWRWTSIRTSRASLPSRSGCTGRTRTAGPIAVVPCDNLTGSVNCGPPLSHPRTRRRHPRRPGRIANPLSAAADQMFTEPSSATTPRPALCAQAAAVRHCLRNFHPFGFISECVHR
jgi:hypothetical protein